MSQSQNKGTDIVLNKMYTGGFLDDNIGHEIINLFKADDKENYIYLCKDGKYSRKFLPKYTIQVRTYGTRTLEIINIAEIERRVSLEEIKGVKYGEVLITEIFDGNADQGTDTYITFKASRVIKPNSQYPVYIAYEGNRNRKDNTPNSIVNDDAFILNEIKENNKYNFDVNEQMRNYIEENNSPKSDYSKLNKIIEDAFKEYENRSGLWEAVGEIITPAQLQDDNQEEVTPAEIYGIGNLELPYSNAFSFFLKTHPKLLSGFCQYLKESEGKDLDELCRYLNANPDARITIKREWENIDLLIEIDDEWVIIVENKIFSDLNGKVSKEITQLDKYYEIVKKHYVGRKQLFVLLTPNHNNIDIQKYPMWRKLFYSSVAQYLKIANKGVGDANLKAFSIMIERHSDVDYNLGEMRRRFEKVLKEHQS